MGRTIAAALLPLPRGWRYRLGVPAIVSGDGRVGSGRRSCQGTRRTAPASSGPHGRACPAARPLGYRRAPTSTAGRSSPWSRLPAPDTTVLVSAESGPFQPAVPPRVQSQSGSFWSRWHCSSAPPDAAGVGHHPGNGPARGSRTGCLLLHGAGRERNGDRSARHTGVSTGPYLHIETHTGGLFQNRVDPARWLAARGTGLGC